MRDCSINLALTFGRERLKCDRLKVNGWCEKLEFPYVVFFVVSIFILKKVGMYVCLKKNFFFMLIIALFFFTINTV